MSYWNVLKKFRQRLQSDFFWPVRYFSWIYCHWSGSSVFCGIIFSTLVIVGHVMTSAYICSYFTANARKQQETNVSVLAVYCKVTAFTLTVPFLVTVWMIRGRRRVDRVILDIVNADEKLSTFGQCPSKNSASKKLFLLIILPLALIGVVSWYDKDIVAGGMPNDLKVLVIYHARYGESVILYIQYFFAFFASNLGDRYRAINSVLKKMSQDYSRELGNTQRLNSDWITTMRELRAVHRKLFFAAEEISQAFGFQLLIITLSSLCLVIADMYKFYLENVLFCGSTPQPFIEYLIWWVVHIGPLCIAAFCCSRTSAQEKYTAVLLQEMSVSDEVLRMEISTFSLQLIHYDLHFSVCGFFNIDLSLIQVIVGTIATYLVILIQIGTVPSHCRNIFSVNSSDTY